MTLKNKCFEFLWVFAGEWFSLPSAFILPSFLIAETSSLVWLFGVSGLGVGLGDGSGASSAATEWKVTSRDGPGSGSLTSSINAIASDKNVLFLIDKIQ